MAVPVCSARFLALLPAILLLAGCASLTGPDRLEPLRLNAAAMAAYDAGEAEQALELYRELAHRDAASAVGWYRLGNLEAGEGNLKAAARALERALELEPDYPEAAHNLGVVHMRRGAAYLRDARPGMRGRGTARAADAYVTCLLADVVEAVDLSGPCRTASDGLAP